MVNSHITTEYHGCSPYAALPAGMKALAKSYSGSGNAALDKNTIAENTMYDLGAARINVQRHFDTQRRKSNLVRELIAERQQKWYTGSGNIAAASQHKEGR